MSKRVKLIGRAFSAILSFQLIFSNTGYITKASTNNLISFAYPDFNNATTNSLIQLTGNPSIQSPELVLTPSAFDQASSAFFKQKVSIANDKSFSTFFKFTISNNINRPGFEAGADGLVFVLNNNQNSLGSLGSGIGYSNITNSVGIEYDTYPNTGSPIYDPNNNHIGIDVNGSPTSLVTTTNLNGIVLKSGAQLYSWVDYNGSTNLIEIRLNNTSTRPATPVLSYTLNLSSVLNSTDVYAGFTSATGSAASKHAIQAWYFDSKYNPIDTDNNTYSFAPTSVTGTANPASDTKSTNLTFTVRDANNNIMPGVNVGFSTNLGTLSKVSAISDSNGQVSVGLSGASSTGNAVVKAVADGGAYTNVTINNFIDSIAPTNQDSVLTGNKAVSSEESVPILSSGSSGNTVWLAPQGTTTFAPGRNMTSASGTSTSIKAPSNEGSYKLYLVDAAGNVSSPSTYTVTVKNIGLFAGKYGKAQIFDVQRSPAYPSVGQQFNLYNFQNIFDSTTGTQIDWGTNSDRYVQFVNTSTQASSSYPSAYTVSLDLHEADGTFVKRISNYGTVWGLGAKGLFYEGHDHYGYFISNQQGFPYGSSLSYTPDTGLVTDVNDLKNYNATTTVLQAGDRINLDANSVLTGDKFVKVGNNISIVSSGNSKNTIWLAPEGTTTFAEGSTMTKAEGTAETMTVPGTEGVYKLYIVDVLGNISQPSSASVTVDSTAPSNEDSVLASSKNVKGNTAVALQSSGDANNTIWLAPQGTTNFVEGSNMSKAGGTDPSIYAPGAEGSYKLYVVDAAGNISQPSVASVTVDNTAPVISGVENESSYYIRRTVAFEDNSGSGGITATYTKDNGQAITLENNTTFEEPGNYTITTLDAAGNESSVTFQIKKIPIISDVLYTNPFKSLIDAIRNEFGGHNDLTDPYKTNTDNSIKDIENTYANLDSQVQAIISEVSAIPTAEDGLIAKKGYIQSEIDKINSLTEEQKSSLTNQISDLNSLLNKIASLEQQVSYFKTETDSIPANLDGLIAQRTMVQYTLDRIGALTKEQKDLLADEISKLNGMLQSIDNLEAKIAQVKEETASIPTAEDGLIGKKSVIQDEINTINSLTEEQKASLTDEAAKLNDLLNKINSLETQVNYSVNEVANIPAAEDGLISQKDKIQTALDRINGLTEEQKNILQPQILQLNDMLEKIAELKDTVAEVKNEVSSIPTAEEGLLAQKDKILAELAKINGLTQEQKELLQGEITSLSNLLSEIKVIEDRNSVGDSKAKLGIIYGQGDSKDKVTQNLKLLTLDDSGVSVKWSTSDASLIDENGQVKRPSYLDGGKTVTLTATLTKGEAILTKFFTVYVQKLPITDAEAVKVDKDKLNISYNTGNSSSNVYDALGLSTSGGFGSTISWKSSNAALISDSGKVTRPSYSDGDMKVTLTATIKKGAAISTKTFEVTVKRLPQYNNPTVPAQTEDNNTGTQAQESVNQDNFKGVVGSLINSMLGSTDETLTNSVSDKVKSTVSDSVGDMDANAKDTELNSEKAGINVNMGDLLLNLGKNLSDNIKAILSDSNDNVADAAVSSKLNMQLIESDTQNVILSMNDAGNGNSVISVDNLKDYTWYTVKVDVVVNNKVIGTTQQKILTPDRTSPVISSVSIKK